MVIPIQSCPVMATSKMPEIPTDISALVPEKKNRCTRCAWPKATAIPNKLGPVGEGRVDRHQAKTSGPPPLPLTGIRAQPCHLNSAVSGTSGTPVLRACSWQLFSAEPSQSLVPSAEWERIVTTHHCHQTHSLTDPISRAVISLSRTERIEAIQLGMLGCAGANCTSAICIIESRSSTVTDHVKPTRANSPLDKRPAPTHSSSLAVPGYLSTWLPQLLSQTGQDCLRLRWLRARQSMGSNVLDQDRRGVQKLNGTSNPQSRWPRTTSPSTWWAGGDKTPNEGMAACRWIYPEIVGPESSQPASGRSYVYRQDSLPVPVPRPAQPNRGEGIGSVRHRTCHYLACVHVRSMKKSLCGPQMQRPPGPGPDLILVSVPVHDGILTLPRCMS
ncbi:hypothetical protein F5883DRAFT_109926 [Diaporthe sp. PMI_573]|nr:hypothetical protein F5883DRAFT_109926 [Diaporthaceae sp. PMI_573]